MVELLQPFETDYVPLSAEDLGTITAAGASAPYRQWGSHWPHWVSSARANKTQPPQLTKDARRRGH